MYPLYSRYPLDSFFVLFCFVADGACFLTPVSYTHLTLPTIYSV